MTTAMRTSVVRANGWHRPLMGLAAAMVLTGSVSAVGYVVDDRILTGVPIWSKPLQFSISFGLYAVTLAWLIARLQGPKVRRLGNRSGTVIAWAVGLEMTAVVVQVLRGQRSHFNVSSPFNAAVFAGMGVLVVVIFVATVIVGVALLRESTGDPVTTRAVRLGLAITVLGMAVGFLMVMPRASQGPGSPVSGAHSVGVADGGPSVPLVGWSTTGGDLRVPHFVGLHALQVLPLLAIALAVLPAVARLASRTRARLVAVGAGGYLGLFALSLLQGLRGQPVTAPDGWTWGGLAVVVIAVAVSTAGVVRSERVASCRPAIGPAVAPAEAA